MNRLYLDNGAEFLRTFNIMSKIVDKGGDGNMHTGAERVMFLWDYHREYRIYVPR